MIRINPVPGSDFASDSNLSFEPLSRPPRFPVWIGVLQLVWRDGCATIGWLCASLLLPSLLMAWYLIGDFSNSNLYPLESVRWLYALAWVSPVMFLLGAVVSCFASERDSVSFQWCSSLPIRWYQAWFVKLGWTAVNAVLCWAVCWYVADYFVKIGSFKDVYDTQPGAIDAIRQEMQRYWPNIFLFFSVGMLSVQLTSRIITAVGVGGVISLPFCIFPHDAKLSYPHQLPSYGESLYGLFPWLINPLVAGVCLLAAATVVYRWRWHSGMYSSGLAGWLNIARHYFVRETKEPTWGPGWSPPSPFMGLIWLSCRKYVMLWWWIGLAGVLVFAGRLSEDSSSVQVPLELSSLLILTCFLLYVLTVSRSFNGELAGGSQSFLADRGISATSYWWSHYGVGVLVVSGLLGGLWYWCAETAPLVTFGQTPSERLVLTSFLVVIVTHSVGVLGLLASQLTSRWEIAFLHLLTATIVFVILGSSATNVSGVAGLIWHLSVISVLGLVSWGISWRGLVGLQSGQSWAFPVLCLSVAFVSLIGASWLRVYSLPPADPVLAQVRGLPIIDVNALHGFGRWTNLAHPGPITDVNAEDIPQKLRRLCPELKEMLECIESCSPQELDPTIFGATQGPRVERATTLTPKVGAYHQLTQRELRELGSILGALGDTALTAIEVGELEVAELCMKLRVRLVTAARPLLGICSFDVLQSRFLEACSDADDNFILNLATLLEKDSQLLTGDLEPARSQWVTAMEIQFSFVYRNGYDWTNSRDGADSSLGSEKQPEIDRWLGELQFRRVLRRPARIRLCPLPTRLEQEWERERYRREVGIAFEQFQQYVRDGTYPTGLSQVMYGESVSVHDLLQQIDNWHSELAHVNMIQARIEALRCDRSELIKGGVQ